MPGGKRVWLGNDFDTRSIPPASVSRHGRKRPVRNGTEDDMSDSPSLPFHSAALAVALRYLRHFPEALDEGATLCLPTGESLFISAETVRASSQEAIG